MRSSSLGCLLIASSLGFVACSREDANAAAGTSTSDLTGPARCNIEWRAAVDDAPLPTGTESRITTGDFDGDGVDDVVVMRGHEVSPFLGSKEGLRALASARIDFGDKDDVLLGPVPIDNVVTGDFDGDGRLDIVGESIFLSSEILKQATETRVVELRGKGDGTFEPAIFVTKWTESSRLLAADFNRDGRTDLLLRTAEGTFVGFGKNTGNFELTATSIPGRNPEQDEARIGDFDADGYPDVVTGGRAGIDNQFMLSLFLQRSERHDFATASVSYLSWGEDGPAENDFAVADLNDDGHADALSGGSHLTRFLGETRAEGGAFQPPSSVDGGSERIGLLADFDGDKKPDALLVGARGLSVACNIGGEAFEPKITAMTLDVDLAGVRSFGDFDGDGKQDIVVLGGATQSTLTTYYTQTKATKPTSKAPETSGDGDGQSATLPGAPERNAPTTDTRSAEREPATSVTEPHGCSAAPTTVTSPRWLAVLGAALMALALRRRATSAD